MKNMTLQNIAAACQGKLVYRDPSGNLAADKEITGVVIDSRKLEPGNLFIAVRGEKVDGHSFISQVMENGAAAVVCEEVPEVVPTAFILVKDSLKALREMAIFYRSQINITIVGITGSVGKTSSKEFIAATLEVRYRVLKTEGNYNNEIGLPLMILKIRKQHEVAVLEMGISDFGEMHRLSEMARPDVAVLTNIGDCHLEHLSDRAGVLKAKSEIFDFLASDGHVVLNGDDILLRSIAAVNGKVPLRFGIWKENDIVAELIRSLELNGTFIEIEFTQSGEAFEVNVPLPGEHMIYNALAAATVGNLLGLEAEEIQAGIENMKSVPGRSHIMRMPWGYLIDDCYNANPVSMKAAIKLLKSVKGRKVAILGDMLELGAEEQKLHAQIGREVIAAGIDVLICIGKLSLFMYEAAFTANEYLKEHCMGNYELYYFPDKNSFLDAVGDILFACDTVLMKASRGMAFETMIEVLKEDSFYL